MRADISGNRDGVVLEDRRYARVSSIMRHSQAKQFAWIGHCVRINAHPTPNKLAGS